MRAIGREVTRVLLSGIAGAVVWGTGLVFVFGPAQQLLADPNRQSAKFLAAFTEEPLPRVAAQPELLAVILLVVGLIHASAYRWLEPRLSGRVYGKGLKFGLLAWALMVPWFELYLPWNVMHEPISLVLVEAFCWLVVLLGVGLAIAAVDALFSRKGARAGG